MTDETLEHLVELCSDPKEAPFGQWISSLFSLVDSQVEVASISQKKELFLRLLGELIKKRIIVIFPPEECYRNGKPVVPTRKDVRNYYDQNTNFDNVWDATDTEVIEYVRDHWPEGVTDVDDEGLNMFWYGNHCPRIGWYDQQTDSVIAS